MPILNFNPELVPELRKVDNKIDFNHLKANQRAIERHLYDDHYTRGFTPGDFVLGGAAAHIQITLAAPQWSAIAMPDAVDSYATVSWRKPSEWRSGKLRLRVWYTSDVGSTNNFLVFYRFLAIKGSEVVPGTLLTANPATNTFAGPAVANTLVKSADKYSTISFGGDDELFSLQLGRGGADAADTNVNDFLLLYVTVEHVPAVQEAT